VLLGIGVAALIAALISISVGEGGPGAPEDVGGVNDVQRVLGGIHQEDSELGPEDAEVTVTVFNDIQCEPCAKFQIEVVDELVERYARTDEAKLEFRHFPLVENETTLAAIAAEAAGEQARQWQYIDTFVRNQALAAEQGVTEELLREIAEAIPNLELPDWDEAFADPETEELVREDGFLAAELELPGEPAVVVSGPGGQRELIETPTLAEVEAAIAAVS
jgi:protein-disulfide isomerase